MQEAFADLRERVLTLETALADREKQLHQLSTGIAATFAFLIQNMEEAEPGMAGPLIRTIEAMRDGNPPGSASGMAANFFHALATQLRRTGLIK